MKSYVPIAEAERTLQTVGVLEYPNLQDALAQRPYIEPFTKPSTGQVIGTGEPDSLIVEASFHMGERQRVLDVGCGMGKNALYLAAHGHSVTAIDADKYSVDWTNQRARDLGIPARNLVVRQGDIKDLTADDKYQTVISTMVWHFLNQHGIKKVSQAIKDATAGNGFNVISVYTNDNPEEEITKRGLEYMFRPGELAAMYGNGWRRIRNVEGYGKKAMDRSEVVGAVALIPSIAEVIARKNGGGLTSYMRPNGQLIYANEV